MKRHPRDWNGPEMPTHLVNLDALIKREDFEARADNPSQSKRLGAELKVEDLERTYIHLLRKPDFQRETSSWTPERVAEFVKSYLDGDLIPAVIMWWSSLNGTVFVIDGAHRLSALMAWVHDDYGDGEISRTFWEYSISPTQRRLALATKQLLEKEIGPYKQLRDVRQDNSKAANPLMLRRARNMTSFKIDLQWVEGNAVTAEQSFFRINGSASIIDPTELGIIKARRKPNAIATRALMNAGKGHQYWSDFPDSARSEIESLSRNIYDSLFKPILESPVKTLDLPIAGQGYSENAFKMIFDLVNMVNNVTPAMWQEKAPPKRSKAAPSSTLSDDTDGATTVEFLRAVRKAAWLVSGHEHGSLGLHPVVYFYGSTGRFQPTAFLATIRFVQELKARDKLLEFTEHRRDFEEFLVEHRHFVSSIGHSYGSRTRPLEALVTMYRVIFSELCNGEKDRNAIRQKLLDEKTLSSLRNTIADDGTSTKRKHFTKDEKSAAFIRQAIDQPARCPECGARLHVRSISTDHIERLEDGGTGSASNAQSSHPYCNQTFKEERVRRATTRT